MHRQTSIVILVLAVVALSGLTPASADESCPLNATFTELRHETDAPGTGQVVETEPEILFYELPVHPGDALIEVGLLRGERSVLVEQIRLIDGYPTPKRQGLRAPDGIADLGPTVVEVLSDSPAQRDRIQRFAGSGELSVEVRLDGALVDSLALEELVRRSSLLKQRADLAPRAITPQIREPADASGLHPLSAASTSCEDQCLAQYDRCADECVFSPDSDACFASCQAGRDDCLAECSGTCTETTTTSTEITEVSTTFLGPIECLGHPSFGRDRYALVDILFKKTITTTTTHADCTETVTTDVTYFTNRCWQLYQLAPDCFVTNPSQNFC